IIKSISYHNHSLFKHSRNIYIHTLYTIMLKANNLIYLINYVEY
ncbi:MAG: hypothetical protein RLZZ210_784, partial [Pseudomonadota bacterium]